MLSVALGVYVPVCWHSYEVKRKITGLNNQPVCFDLSVNERSECTD
jgi:hypothetical protein